jgi:hypothetical protein
MFLKISGKSTFFSLFDASCKFMFVHEYILVRSLATQKNENVGSTTEEIVITDRNILLDSFYRLSQELIDIWDKREKHLSHKQNFLMTLKFLFFGAGNGTKMSTV